MNELSELGLGLDKSVGDVHLSAESWQPDDKFNWVHIDCNYYELGQFLFDQGGDVVQTELQNLGFLSVLGLLVSSLILSGRLKSLLLVLLGLWGVLGQQLEEVVLLVSLQGGSELVDLGWDLKSGQQDSLLSLQEDVLWPSDESGDVLLGLAVSTDSEVLGGLLEEGVFNLLGFFGRLFLVLFSHFFASLIISNTL